MQLIRDGLGSIPAAIHPISISPSHTFTQSLSLSFALVSPMTLYLLSIFQRAAAIATTVSSPRPPLPLNPIRPNTINYPASQEDLGAFKGLLRRFKSIDVSDRNSAPPPPPREPSLLTSVLASVYVCVHQHDTSAPAQTAAHHLRIFNHVPTSPGKLLPCDGNR